MGPRGLCGRQEPTQTSEPMARCARTACGTCGQKRAPGPSTPTPVSQEPGTQTAVFRALGGGVRPGRSCEAVPSPYLQNELIKGCARAKSGLNTERRELAGSAGLGAKIPRPGGSRGTREGGPGVEVRTCASGSRWGRRGGVPGFSPRPAPLPDPIVSGSASWQPDRPPPGSAPLPPAPPPSWPFLFGVGLLGRPAAWAAHLPQASVHPPQKWTGL